MKVKGFTAIELTVAMGLMSVLVLLCCGLMTLSENLSYRNAQLNSDKFSADSVYDLVTEKLLYANSLNISNVPPDGNVGDVCVMSVRDGRLFLDNEDIYGESFYGGASIELLTSVVNADKGLLSVEIRVLDENGEQQYSKGSIITILNISRKSGSIQSTGGTSLVNPYIYYTLYGFNETTETTSVTTTTTTPPTTQPPETTTEFTFSVRPLSNGADSTIYTLKASSNTNKSAWTISTVSNIPQLNININNIGSFTVQSWTNCSAAMNGGHLEIQMNSGAVNFSVTLTCAAQTTPNTGDATHHPAVDTSTETTTPVTQPPSVQETVISLSTNVFTYQYWRPPFAMVGNVYTTDTIVLTREQLLSATNLTMNYTAQNIHNSNEKIAFIFNIQRSPDVVNETNFWSFIDSSTALYYAPMVESGTLSMPISLLLPNVPENSYLGLIGILPIGDDGNTELTTITVTKLALT